MWAKTPPLHCRGLLRMSAASLLGLVHRLIGTVQDRNAETQSEARPLSAGSPDQAPAKVFVTCFPLEAEVIRGFLEANDIPASVQQEAISQVYPLTVGDLADTCVLVPAALASQARALLAEQKAARAGKAESTGEFPGG